MKKTKLFLSTMLIVLLGSIAATAQTYNQVWIDYGNSVFNMTLDEVIRPDRSVSTDNYDFSSDSPAVPLAPGAANKNAFRYVRSSSSKSSFPNFKYQINGGLKSEVLDTDNVVVKIKVAFYIVADADGSSGVNLAGLKTSKGKDLRFILQLIDSDGVAKTTASIRPRNSAVDFNTGWQELEFLITVRPRHATNLNQYDQFKIVLGSTAEDPSTGLKLFTDGANFLNEDVYFYIDSVKSNIEIKGI